MVRLLERQDIPAAVDIVTQNYPEEQEYIARVRGELESAFGNGVFRPSYVAAEENGVVVGFAGYMQAAMDYDVYEVFWVNVAPAFQGRGVGSALVDEVLRRVTSAGAKTVLLTTTTPEWYERWGFSVLLKHSGDYVLMSKRV